MNRRLPASVVILLAAIIGAFVYVKTGDEIRGGVVLYVALVILFALHEGHDAFAVTDPRRGRSETA